MKTKIIRTFPNAYATVYTLFKPPSELLRIPRLSYSHSVLLSARKKLMYDPLQYEIFLFVHICNLSHWKFDNNESHWGTRAGLSRSRITSWRVKQLVTKRYEILPTYPYRVIGCVNQIEKLKEATLKQT